MRDALRQVVMGIAVAWLSPALLAAQVPADSARGVVVRIATQRISGRDAAPRSHLAGLLVRQQGARQRVDVLQAAGDTIGDDWANMDHAPQEMLLHNRRSRASAMLRLADLRLVFDSLLRLRVDSVSVDGEELGAGPVLLGQPTRRVRIRRAFRMTSTRNGRTQVVRVTSQSDALVAPALPESWGASTVLSLTSSSVLGVMQEVFSSTLSPPRVRGGGRLPAGLALRVVTRSEARASGPTLLPLGVDDEAALMVDSAEVVSIERRTFPDSLFDAPPSYKQLDLSQELRKMVVAMDELGRTIDGASGKRGDGSKRDFPNKPTSKP